MRTILLCLGLPLLVVPLVAQQALPPAVGTPSPAPAAAVLEKTRRMTEAPWVGFDVRPLDAATRAHAREVPDGAGFLVAAVDAEGPAGKAGIRTYDIVWRFADQVLVNEAQFAVLLRLHKPGDAVRFTVVRSGEPKEVELTLAAMPERKRGLAVAPSEIPLIPNGVPEGPVSRVFPQERTAEITREDGGVARLRYEDDHAHVTISTAEGVLIYEGPVRKDGEWRVPKEWGCTVGALMRSLYRAEHGDSRTRVPRPRVVVPPSTGSR